MDVGGVGEYGQTISCTTYFISYVCRQSPGSHMDGGRVAIVFPFFSMPPPPPYVLPKIICGGVLLNQ